MTHMPKNHIHAKHPVMRKERIAYGIFISALGCLWLAAELDWIQTSLPIGPITVIVIGFAMLLPWVEK